MRILVHMVVQGFKGIGRHIGHCLASVGTMTACLFLFGVVFLLVMNVDAIAEEAEAAVGITVFFNEDITDERREALGEEIRAAEGVTEVIYTSADEAWARYREEALDEELAETFGDDNPLAGSDSFTVYLSDVANTRETAAYIEKLDGVRKVNSSADVAGILESFNLLITRISTMLLAVLLFVAVFLIAMTVAAGILARKDEIELMRLVGGTNAYIWGPFVWEGIVIGLIGSTLPLILVWVLYDKAELWFAENFSTLSSSVTLIPAARAFDLLIPICLATGVGIGLIGSFITVRRHMDV